MSLIFCPECHARISSSAVTCPHCGFVAQSEETGVVPIRFAAASEDHPTCDGP